MEDPEALSTYLKLDERIEIWSNLFHFLVVQVTVPLVIMPKFLISFYLYFATDLGSEAFNLPFPVWCVMIFSCQFYILCMISVISYISSFSKDSVRLENTDRLFGYFHNGSRHNLLCHSLRCLLYWNPGWFMLYNIHFFQWN